MELCSLIVIRDAVFVAGITGVTGAVTWHGERVRTCSSSDFPQHGYRQKVAIAPKIDTAKVKSSDTYSLNMNCERERSL